MTELEKLTMLYQLCGDSEVTPELLSVYLEMAEGIVVRRAYPYLTNYVFAKVPKRYETLQLQIACELYLHRGAEGEQGHSENGIVRSYENGSVSESLLKQITPFGRVLNEKVPSEIEVNVVSPETMSVGNSEALVVTTTVVCTDRTIIEAEEGYGYESNDEAVLKVSNDGILTAIAPGTATVRVTGKKSETSTLISVEVV